MTDADWTVGSLATRVVPLAPGASIADAAARLAESGEAGRLSLPVVAGSQPRGIVSRQPLMELLLVRSGREFHRPRPVTEAMNAQPVRIGAATPLRQAAWRLARELPRPVVDDFLVIDAAGDYLGMAAAADLLAAAGDARERAWPEGEGGHDLRGERRALAARVLAVVAAPLAPRLAGARDRLLATAERLADADAFVGEFEALIEALQSEDIDDVALERRLAVADARAADLRAGGTIDDLRERAGSVADELDRLACLARTAADGGAADGTASAVDAWACVDEACALLDGCTATVPGVERVPGCLPAVRASAADLRNALAALLVAVGGGAAGAGLRLEGVATRAGAELRMTATPERAADATADPWSELDTVVPLCDRVLAAAGGGVAAARGALGGVRVVVSLAAATVGSGDPGGAPAAPPEALPYNAVGSQGRQA